MSKRVDRESPVQIEIVNFLRAHLPPECIVHHARGEINRSGRSVMVELAKAKHKGALAGFPDLVVLPYASVGPIFLEVKAEGNYADKTQKAMHERLRNLGYRIAVVRSVEDVKESFAEWGVSLVRPYGVQSVTLEVRGQIT